MAPVPTHRGNTVAANAHKIDVKRLVARFGGPQKLHGLLIRRGFKLSLKTINQWGWRRRIPGPWLTELMAIAESQGRPLRIRQYQLESEDEDMDFLQ